MGIGKKEKPKPFLKYELPYAKPSWTQLSFGTIIELNPKSITTKKVQKAWPSCLHCEPWAMSVGWLQRTSTHHLVRVEAVRYSQINQTENVDVFKSYGLFSWVSTGISNHINLFELMLFEDTSFLRCLSLVKCSTNQLIGLITFNELTHLRSKLTMGSYSFKPKTL